MKKTLLLLTALFAMLLCAQIALADTLTMPDPVDMGYDLAFYESSDSQYCYSRTYKARTKDIAHDAALAYVDMLMQYDELTHVQCVIAPNGWIFHVLDAAEGFSYDQFCSTSGEWQTKNGCAAVLYHPDKQWVQFRFSKDFTLASDLAKPTAKPTPKTCSVCDGSGKCPDCGGDMWVTKWEWVYVNGSPESQLVTKLCDGVYCYGGSCLKCRGDD